jgi:divalent metal cation (Fe/Co/Zn/Cd) transporter
MLRDCCTILIEQDGHASLESWTMSSVKRKALALSIFTVAYNLVEGGIAIAGASRSGSTALWGFGLDSFIESLSGCVIVWRFWKYQPQADEEEFEQIDQTATRLVAYTFFILGAYISLEAISAVYTQETPATSLIGIGLAIASLIVMPILFVLKFRLGKAIGSQSLIADSKETLACMSLSVALLIGLGAFYIWRLWWIDSACSLIIAALVFKEGYKTFQESHKS